MKKVLTAAAIVVLAAATAFAFGGGRGWQGDGYGMGYGMGGGYGMMGGAGNGRGGYGPCWQQDGDEDRGAPAAVSEADAKTKAQAFLDQNLKGFKITDESKFENPRGTAYRFSVKDSNGNQFYVMVNPFGYVRGPIPFNTID